MFFNERNLKINKKDLDFFRLFEKSINDHFSLTASLGLDRKWEYMAKANFFWPASLVFHQRANSPEKACSLLSRRIKRYLKETHQEIILGDDCALKFIPIKRVEGQAKDEAH